MTTTSTPTPTSWRAGGTPCCSITSSRSARCAAGEGSGSSSSRKRWPSATTWACSPAPIPPCATRWTRRWGVWDATQGALFQRILRSGAHAPAAWAPAAAISYLPSLARAAGLTAMISVLSMGLAVAVGLGLASGRLYGPGGVRGVATVYIEVVRGTPLLLQLFVIYYGLAGVVRLPAVLAAVLGLGLNYAAYEAEIYRGALQAVPAAQLEAARTLGFSEGPILLRVRGPQALRYALAPMTNDFVALLKDSSLVSVITVVELTKQTAIYATNVGSWIVPGALCAAVYLVMSLPLARLARGLERRWRAP